MDHSKLSQGDKVWIVNWHGRNEVIGAVERTTSTQIVVVVDYSFQGGTNRSVKKFKRFHGKHGYGSGNQIGGGMCPDHLGRTPTDSEIEIQKIENDRRHRARTNALSQERAQTATRARLNALLPDGVYVEVNRDQDEFSVHIGALVSETEVMEIVKRLKHYRPAKKAA